MKKNIDPKTVKSFGDEWSRFDQSSMSQEESKKIIYKLIETADVIIDNFRPGALERLGLDYDNIKKHNPKSAKEKSQKQLRFFKN